MLGRGIIQHHKKLSLELVPDVSDLQEPPAAGTALAAPPRRPSSRQGLRTSSRRRSSSTELDAMERQERSGRPSGSDPAETLMGSLRVDGTEARVSLTATGLEWAMAGGGCCAGAGTCHETLPFSEMLSVEALGPRGGRGATACLSSCLGHRTYRIVVFTFSRSPRRRADWRPRQVVLETPDADVAREWAAALGAGIQAAAAERPRSLMVVLNPKAGNRRSRVVYKRIVEPVFVAAGIKATVVESEWSGHASAMLQRMPLEELCAFDGIVGVGGDGVFHELMNGLLTVRASYAASPPEELLALRLAHIPAGSTDAVACTFHGTRSVFTAAMHIALGDRTALDVLRLDTPDGTTDFSSCMASYGFMGDVMASSEKLRFLGPMRYDLMGTLKLLACKAYPARVSYIRGSYMTAALSSHRHKVCGINCEVCRAASRASLRRLTDKGASMAAAAGLGSTAVPASSATTFTASASGTGLSAATVAQHAAQQSQQQQQQAPTQQQAPQRPGSPALPRPPSLAASIDSSSDGGTGSDRDRADRSRSGRLPPLAGSPSAAAVSEFLHPAATAPQRHEEEWVSLEGEFVSIMLLNMPCISEKTRAGIVRAAHLADGTIKLVLVRKCSPLHYLKFLLDMSHGGLAPGQHSYVEVIDAVAVKVECPEGRPLSHWNLDGELLRSATIAAEIHQGLIQVFARGVER